MGEERNHGFIAGIHNYCDRWCERCPFTSRCRAFAIEMTIAVDGFEGQLAAAAADLEPPSGEGGPEFDFLAEEEDVGVTEADTERETLRRDAAWLVADTHPLLEAVKTLVKLAEPLIEGAGRHTAARGADAEAFRDPFEVLCRYRYFILVKVHRALLGREQDATLDEAGQPMPSDADGSAKIAYITCSAARVTARLLASLDPSLAGAATAYEETAEQVLRLIDQVFPSHRSFRRPGFDDVLPA